MMPPERHAAPVRAPTTCPRRVHVATGRLRTGGAVLCALFAAAVTGTAATRDAFFRPANGENLGVWRITDDPSARHWANYHNTRCWSFDGRYLCYTKKAHDRSQADVYLYDAHLDVARRIASGDFSASRLWYDLDGTNERIGIPLLQNAHTSWLGNGAYHLMSNGLVRGRSWDEPFPSNVHILASVTVGDVSPCGASGRFVTGDKIMADLRSGDGWNFIDPLSIICFPADVGDESTIYDADPKGSPDGTKVAFVSNYDLKRGPVSFLAADVPVSGDALPVKSTLEFPERGLLVVGHEVIGYSRKTTNAFEGLSCRQYDTSPAPLREGQAVTLFTARLLPDEDGSGGQVAFC